MTRIIMYGTALEEMSTPYRQRYAFHKAFSNEVKHYSFLIDNVP
jgi:hypothetical protein